MKKTQLELTQIYAQFLNDGINLVVDLMSPIWNNHTNIYSLSVDGAVILEIIKMWTNEYICGKRENKFFEYFEQNIDALRKDTRYLNNDKIQKYCSEYYDIINSQYLGNSLNSNIGDTITEIAGNPCIGRTEYKVIFISSIGNFYGKEIFCNVRDLEINDVI